MIVSRNPHGTGPYLGTITALETGGYRMVVTRSGSLYPMQAFAFTYKGAKKRLDRKLKKLNRRLDRVHTRQRIIEQENLG